MTMRRRVLGSSIGLVAFVTAAAVADVPQSAVVSFDHNYRVYATLLRAHVEGRGVNYRKLKTNRAPSTRSRSTWDQSQGDPGKLDT